jgi:hypothetical protein
VTRRQGGAFLSAPEAQINVASPSAWWFRRVSRLPRYDEKENIVAMAHIAKLGALTDELVTLLTSTSAKVNKQKALCLLFPSNSEVFISHQKDWYYSSS